MTLVAMPVYNAADALGRCLRSLEQHLPPEQAIVICDDASTDVRVGELLDGFCDRSTRTLLRNPTNRGFVATANRLLDQGRDDVVLLNSDTRVTPNWLAALERCAASDPMIGTITPFSNHAEICSFPDFCRPNPVPADPDAVARAIARIGRPTYPRLPTAVGFCMWVRRRLLDEIGAFDESAFGRGYGEENDFCMRASAAGYHHVLCDDAYVVHEGGASFAETGLKPGPETMARLLAKHPDYETLVHRFIATDPIAARRAELLAGMNAYERGQLA
ncbi:MAG: glycosyltransferase [Xanthomonadales bacterium]|nr:glycosyltransferase [Xanthomonadales bacterium]